MTTSVRFCLSYNPLKYDYIAVKANIISIRKRIVDTCGDTIFITRRYPLNNSDVIYMIISIAGLFMLTKHTALLFYHLSPRLPSCMRSTRNVRKKMNFNNMIMKFCAQLGSVYNLNFDAGRIRTR